MHICERRYLVLAFILYLVQFYDYIIDHDDWPSSLNFALSGKFCPSFVLLLLNASLTIILAWKKGCQI